MEKILKIILNTVLIILSLGSGYRLTEILIAIVDKLNTEAKLVLFSMLVCIIYTLISSVMNLIKIVSKTDEKKA